MVRPHYKGKGDKLDPDSYRPISVFNLLPKYLNILLRIEYLLTWNSMGYSVANNMVFAEVIVASMLLTTWLMIGGFISIIINLPLKFFWTYEKPSIP